jgi:hypothetical protein
VAAIRAFVNLDFAAQDVELFGHELASTILAKNAENV